MLCVLIHLGSFSNDVHDDSLGGGLLVVSYQWTRIVTRCKGYSEILRIHKHSLGVVFWGQIIRNYMTLVQAASNVNLLFSSFSMFVILSTVIDLCSLNVLKVDFEPEAQGLLAPNL